MTETYALLISPRAEAAFFAETVKVAREELSGVAGTRIIGERRHGAMLFFDLALEEGAGEAALWDLMRLSCAQGLFRRAGAALEPLDRTAGFALHPDFVWGEKYRGKTSETLTQLLINLCLQQMPGRGPGGLRLLDPMAGRGTSLLWAIRYGMRAVGIEQDPQALAELRRGLKKWTKLHRQKHKLAEGWVRKTNRAGTGKYIDFTAEGTTLRLLTGPTAEVEPLTQRKPFDLIVTDLPYGVEHRGGAESRSPLDTVAEAAPGWARALAPGGAMAIAFNRYLPRRAELEAAFEGLGLEVVPRDVSHRMSEAILRDVLVLARPADPS